MTTCPFCKIIARQAPAIFVNTWSDAIAIRPLRPVTPGHVLVIPMRHVRDAGVDPVITGLTMRRAAELMAKLPHANLITSRGDLATQTVFHLHVHVIPRVAGDGLHLPWTLQPERG
jgi:histidine triad (HIT) family protein